MLKLKKTIATIALLLFLTMNVYGAYVMLTKGPNPSYTFGFWFNVVFCFMLYLKWIELDNQIQEQKKINQEKLN